MLIYSATPHKCALFMAPPDSGLQVRPEGETTPRSVRGLKFFPEESSEYIVATSVLPVGGVELRSTQTQSVVLRVRRTRVKGRRRGKGA